jgi:hypothetical protein
MGRAPELGGEMPIRIAAFLFACVGMITSAAAAPSAAVFPFELHQLPQEDDYFVGEGKASEEEQRRLVMATDELLALLQAGGQYQLVDIKPVAADIEQASPLYNCNGCETEIAKKVGAGVVVSGVFEKMSATLLRLNINVRDVASGNLTNTMSVVIQGNTDDAWIRGVRWLVKNRMTASREPAQ